MKNVLVTGGCGYIGSHTVVELMKSGYNVVIIDNLCNSTADVLDNIEKIVGKKPTFLRGDIRDLGFLDRVFGDYQFDFVVHFAGLKAVGESFKLPLEYYENNVGGTVCLLKAMRKFHVKRIVFSSSATVYGEQTVMPFTEDMPMLPSTNPYGVTKQVIERMIGFYAGEYTDVVAVILRYFNPIGAHPSGLIGENPNGVPNNLAPYILKVASGELPVLSVYGNDYPTPDGTCLRDYIHVADLARGHVAAIEKVSKPGVHVYNLGTGKGTSVMELLHAFEKACGHEIPFKVVGRRSGDIAQMFAGVEKAKKELGWATKYGIEDMCRDSFKYWLTRGK